MTASRFAPQVLLAGSLLLAGCQGNPESVSPAPDSAPPQTPTLEQAVDPARLEAELNMVLDRDFARIVAMASDIAAQTAERRVRENTLRLKIRTWDAFRDAMVRRDPRLAFLEAWMSATRLRVDLTVGSWQEAFGDQQQRAIKTARDIEQDIYSLGRRHFPGDALEAARDDVEQLAASGGFSLLPDVAEPGPTGLQRLDLLKILRSPLARGLEGVSELPIAIDRFTEVSREFASTVDHMPEMVRWQTELLLLEMQSTGVVASALDRVDRLDRRMGQAIETVQALPGETRKQLEKGLASVEQTVPSVRATLTEARRTAGVIDQTAEATRRTSDSFAVLADKTTATLVEARALVGEFQQMQEKSSAAKPDGPAAESPDVQEYTQLVNETHATVRELRSLLADLDEPMPEQTRWSSITHDAGSLIDRAFSRLAILIVLVAVAGIVYRVVSVRLRARQGTS